jgi:hypothetical protein
VPDNALTPLIARLSPRNLTIVIMDNDIYQITGKQETATAGTTTSWRWRAAAAWRRATGCATRRISSN